MGNPRLLPVESRASCDQTARRAWGIPPNWLLRPRTILLALFLAVVFGLAGACTSAKLYPTDRGDTPANAVVGWAVFSILSIRNIVLLLRPKKGEVELEEFEGYDRRIAPRDQLYCQECGQAVSLSAIACPRCSILTLKPATPQWSNSTATEEVTSDASDRVRGWS